LEIAIAYTPYYHLLTDNFFEEHLNMKLKFTSIIFLILLTAKFARGQTENTFSQTLNEAFSLAKKNSQQLKISRKFLEIAAHEADIQNLNKLNLILPRLFCFSCILYSGILRAT